MHILLIKQVTVQTTNGLKINNIGATMLLPQVYFRMFEMQKDFFGLNMLIFKIIPLITSL